MRGEEDSDSMQLVLGVDGGNSKTLAVVGDDHGTVLGIGRSLCGNHQGYGLESALEQIGAAINQALASGGIRPAQIQAASYALAGADLPSDFELLLPAVRDLGFGRQVDLHNDTM